MPIKAKNKTDSGSRVVLYARVSTEEQTGEDHFSLGAQFAEMREIAAKKGWEVVGEFVDEGISGTKRNRPQLEAVLSLARSRAFDVLMVHELSRLSRSVYYTLDIFDILGKAGIGFASVRDPDFDFADPSKRLFLTILAAINEYYVTALSHHVKKSKRARARQGLYNASSIPYGYKHSGDSKTPPVIEAEEAAIIIFVFETYSLGRYSDLEVAEMLNAKGHRARSGRRVNRDMVTRILTNPFYTGKILYRDVTSSISEVYEGQHQAIITNDLWEKVQEVRTVRNVRSRAVQKSYRAYLLSGLATCDVCGRALRGQTVMPSNKQYYREVSFTRGYIDCPHQNTGVQVEILDSQINYIIQSIQLPPDWLSEVSAQVDDVSQLVEIHRRRDRLEAERYRLQQMRMEGDFDENLDDYREQIERIRREISNLPTYDQIETIRITGKAVQDLYQTWSSANKEDQRDLLRLILREVRVDVVNGRITSIYPLAAFLSIFRKIPMLVEQEFGEFIPLWDASQSHSISGLKQLPPCYTAPPLPSLTLPFFDSRQVLYSKVRSTPGIAEALRLLNARENSATKMVQLVPQNHPVLPMDFRKWPGVTSCDLDMIDFQNLPTDSIDLLFSQYLLFENALDGRIPGEDMLVQIYSRLRSKGVWYFVDIFPQDFSAHWVHRYMPTAWQWAKANTWTIYGLYSQLLNVGFKATIKRKAYSQPTTALAAQDILQKYPSFYLNLNNDSLTQAVKHLQDINNQSVVFPSEFTIIEVWAQRH